MAVNLASDTRWVTDKSKTPPQLTPVLGPQRWSVRGYERTLMPGAQLGHTHIPGWFQHDPAIRLWLDAFLDHWLKEPAEAGTTSP